MLIRDWSSDVCSSDLFDCDRRLQRILPAQCDRFRDDLALLACPGTQLAAARGSQGPSRARRRGRLHGLELLLLADLSSVGGSDRAVLQDRKSVVLGKSVSVRVDIGGRRILKKK